MITVWLSSARTAEQLARHAAARLLRRETAEIVLSREPSGRPVVIGAALFLSLSHIDTAAAVAATTAGPVGVDIERDAPVPDAAALARRWFAPEEADWVATHPAAFLPLWTQKEAAGKALGLGLRDGGLRRLMPLPPVFGETRPVPGHAGLTVVSLRHNGLVVSVALDRT